MRFEVELNAEKLVRPITRCFDGELIKEADVDKALRLIDELIEKVEEIKELSEVLIASKEGLVRVKEKYFGAPREIDADELANEVEDCIEELRQY